MGLRELCVSWFGAIHICTNCGHRFAFLKERLVQGFFGPKVKCPQCQNEDPCDSKTRAAKHEEWEKNTKELLDKLAK